MSTRVETTDRRKANGSTRVRVDGKVTQVTDFDPKELARRLKSRRKRKLTVEERERWQAAQEFKREFQ